MLPKNETNRRALKKLVELAGGGYTAPWLASAVWDSL